MHLTNVLFRIKMIRAFRRVWKKQGKMEIAKLEIPEELQAMNVKIYDAKQMFESPDKLNLENTKTDSSEAAIFDPGKPVKIFYTFDNKVRVSEDESQILALTKTVLYEGLPSVIQSLIGVDDIPDQDSLVQSSILQALVKDGRLDKLPKRVDISNPGYKFPREYGIRYKRKSANLIRKMSYLADIAAGKYVDSLGRNKFLEAYNETEISRNGDTVIFQLLSEILQTSDKPLKPFASASDVENTINEKLPSIYPIKPTLDLIQNETNPCIQNGSDIMETSWFKNHHIHTIHMVHKSFGFWFPVQKLSRAIAGCFSFATEEARKQYGENIRELPQPINIQCIYSDIKTFGFLAYQLNTLNLDSNDGIKNQVWNDGPYDLYEEVDEMHGITNYNSEVFSKMKALYLNGAHPNSL